MNADLVSRITNAIANGSADSEALQMLSQWMQFVTINEDGTGTFDSELVDNWGNSLVDDSDDDDQDVYDILERTPSDERIEKFMNMSSHDLYMYGQPECLFQCFDIQNQLDADEVVKAFKAKMGDIIISREAIVNGFYETVVDYIKQIAEHSNSSNDPTYQYLLNAFNRFGMKFESQIPRYLTILFFCDDAYCVKIMEHPYQYNYPEMKAKYAAVHEELQKVLFHPDRIGKWVDAGNEIEDYLN